MRIAIVHYHLRAGGVNRIIDLAARALTELGHEVAVIAGSPPHSGSLLDPSRVAVVPELDYSAEYGGSAVLGKLVDAAAKRLLGTKPDLWHIHNHSLGKNPAVSALISRWAMERRPIILQLHDFAEQGRAENYRLLRDTGVLSQLYPNGRGVRYALLNSEDARRLNDLGLSHPAIFLPNPVQALPVGSPFDPAIIEADEFLVYPTRAISRKNLGEALLWSSQLPKGKKLVITLAPDTPSQRIEYDAWEELARQHSLPVVFNSVTQFQRPLGDFIAGASASITTSREEGFGMAFLEPWLLGKAVVGRDLPKVTFDFEKEGVSMKWLYSSMPVSLTREESELQYSSKKKLTEKLLAAYGIHHREILRSDTDDFGVLTPEVQQRVIRRILNSDGSDFLWGDLQVERAASMVPSHSSLIAQRYGLKAYGERLEAFYQEALSESGSCSDGMEFLDSSSVLSRFFNTL